MGKIRLALVIHRLDPGGAERQLLALAKGLDKEKFQVQVITFYCGGELEDELLGHDGITLLSLKRKGRWGAPLCLTKLAEALRRTRAHVVYGFMEVPAQMSLLAGRSIGIKVVWGLRRSVRDFKHYDWAEKLSFKTGRILSKGADLIILNSLRGRDDYVKAGYCSKKMTVVPNGIDTNRFQRDAGRGVLQKKLLGVQPEAKLVGLVSRLHPMKGHEVFLRAAKKVAKAQPDVFFVCAGRGDMKRLSDLQSLTAQLGLASRVFWVGEVKDVVGLYSALDIICSSSIYGEGFANVVGEAMSCGVPCVVTNVGDSARVVGDTGIVVPKGNPEELAFALERLISRPRDELLRMGQLARLRVEEKFSVTKMVSSVSRIIEELLTPSAKS